MEVGCKLRPRALKRCYQSNRFEDELWKRAYEQVCPEIRRSPSTSPVSETRTETRRLLTGRA
jgi:hypothetical protein